MMTNEHYIEVRLHKIKPDDADIIIALLTAVGFEGFDETGDVLKAYTSNNEYNENEVKHIAEQFSLYFDWEDVAPQNWNAVWESNFEPVVIDDFVAVRAHFHAAIPHVQHNIVITPKMSFGTGHHATTTMMMQQMQKLDFTNTSVLDFGTGTGILAVLAEKLGAMCVLAIDNDEWSIENSKENIKQNDCHCIQVELKDTVNLQGSFDIILANINRNVILTNLFLLVAQLNKGGYLLVSGLLAEDEAIILAKTHQYALTHINTVTRLQWISLLLSR